MTPATPAQRSGVEPQRRAFGGVILAAADLTAHEDPQLGQGVFTYCLLSGLNALRRDPFPDPIVSPPHLGERGGVIVCGLFRHALAKYDYVIGKIAKVDQDPQIFGDRDFELVPYRDGGTDGAPVVRPRM